MMESPEQEFRVGYRSIFRFKLERGETVERVAEAYMRDWLRTRKEGVDQRFLDSWDGNENFELPSGADVRVTRLDDERSGQNVVRYRIVDKVELGKYRVRFSAMTTTKWRNQLVIVIDVGRNFGSAEDVVLGVHPPRIVEDVLDTREVFDGKTRLQGQPRTILLDDVDELIRAVGDSSRTVPLLIAPSPSARVDEQWRSVVRALTRTASGTAAVFTVSADAVDELNSRLPKSLTVQRGHLRAVAPRVDMENPDMRRHPLWTPEDITSWLGPGGKPTNEAVNTIVAGPRKRVLETPLPADVRRVVQLLEQKERKQNLLQAVDDRVADVSLTRGAPTELVSVAIAASGSLFPPRSEVHKRNDSGNFWDSFRRLMARWLDKHPQYVTEETLEKNLLDLDERIIHDREAIRINEAFLVSVEADRDNLKLEISELKEENESLAVQLENVQHLLRESERAVAVLRAQMGELSIKPAEIMPKLHEAPRLGELQDRIKEVPLAVTDPHTEVGKALSLLGERLDPILQDQLSPHVQGRPWTVILSELDISRDRDPGVYNRHDPGAQLRVLTERLGRLGFPFEVDHLRSVSTTAQQLRVLRNKWGHHEKLEGWDAARAYDATHALLNLLGDAAGASIAQHRRDAALRH